MNIGHITHNLLSSKVFIVLVVICSVVIPFHDVFYRDIVNDEVFMALNVRHYEDSPMAPLTFYLGHIAISLFGDKIITLRILKYLLYFVTIGFSCIFFYKVTGKGKVSWYLFALFALTSTIASMDIYNWDTGSYPFLVLTLISTLAYNHKRNLIYSSMMGICCGLMIASRIPTAVGVPFIILLISLNHDSFAQKLRYASVYLITLLITLWLLMLLIYGSPNGLLGAWSDDNFITGHGLGSAAVSRMTEGVKWILLPVALAWMLAYGCFLSTIVALRLRQHRYVVIAIMGIAIALFARSFAHYDWTAHMCLWQLPAFVFLFLPQLSRLFVTDKGKEVAKINLDQWILLLFALLPGVGSDVFLERLAPMVLMPLILAYIYPSRRRLVTVYCGFMCIAVITMIHYRIKERNEESRVDVSAIHPRLAGVQFKTVDIAESVIQKQIFDRLTANGYTPTFIGGNKYGYTYLFAPDNLYSLQHFHYISFANEKKYLKKLRNYDAIIVNDPVYQGTDSIAFNSYLHTLGFKDSSPTFAPLPSTTRIYLR